jgi:cytochrome c oxidase assembly protein subunit 15
MSFYRKLILAALILTCILVPLGAFVRLSDAGLGCPDWPGCYGKITPHLATAQIDAALKHNPDGVVSHAKAWKEMIHRYVAGSLALLILAIAIQAWRLRPQTRLALPLALLGLIVFQALLGMWTVTRLLKPVIVSAHLLGGMSTLALLVWLWRRESVVSRQSYFAPAHHLRGAATLGLLLVVVQIALGGWVSTNYAALACADFPTCQGSWMPVMDFAHAYTLQRNLGETASGELLPLTALTAIHWTHRVMALIVTLYLLWLASRLIKTPGYTGIAMLLLGSLAVQLALGISNVVYSLPLPVAVAHNAGALLLLAGMVMLNDRVRRN